jgi:hypothetical protein
MMLKEVADYLAATPNSLGTVDTNIFITHIPGGASVPDSLICLYPYAGAPPSKSSPKVENPGLQVVARGLDPATVAATMEAIEDKLSLIANQTLGSTKYLNIEPLGAMFGMGMENKRIKFAQNYRVKRARSNV